MHSANHSMTLPPPWLYVVPVPWLLCAHLHEQLLATFVVLASQDEALQERWVHAFDRQGLEWELAPVWA